jgi:hypothetical protein
LNQLDNDRGAHSREKTRPALRRRARRVAAVGVVGLSPIIALGWAGAGCGDDDAAGGGGVYVDPGGTYGAEFSVTIVGRGRVQTSLPGVDCPKNCFSKYVFSSATADGAAGGVSLKATPTPGSRFKGWSFQTEPVGSRGRGPDECNPVKRPGAQPAVDMNALEITVPFGEVAGTAPTGKEGQCAAYLKVPTVYKVTATFETDPPILEAGPDGDVGDAGPLEVVYEAPAVGATAGEMGTTLSGYLYWVFSVGAQSGIAFGSNPDGLAPQASSIAVPLGSPFTVFEVDYYGVVYQTSAGEVGAIRYGNSSAALMPGVASTCTALAMDSSSNVYCRTASGIDMWQYTGTYSGPIPLYTSGIPAGNDLMVESSSGPIYYTTSTGIESVPMPSGLDGGVATPTPILTGRQSPRNLEGGYGFFWIEGNGTSDTVWATSSRSASPSAYDTGVPAGIGFEHFARYGSSAPSSTSTYWVANSSSIYRAYYVGGSQTAPFRTGLPNIQGIAADSTYVYWSQTDGRIRRAPQL